MFCETAPKFNVQALGRALLRAHNHYNPFGDSLQPDHPGTAQKKLIVLGWVDGGGTLWAGRQLGYEVGMLSGIMPIYFTMQSTSEKHNMLRRVAPMELCTKIAMPARSVAMQITQRCANKCKNATTAAR